MPLSLFSLTRLLLPGRLPYYREGMTQFSLFEGDLFNRLFNRIGLGPRKPLHLLGRILCFWCVTYLPLALLAWHEGLTGARPPSENFFYDIAAYAIFFLSTPLFIIAERVVSTSTRGAALRFASHGVLRDEDAAQLDHLHLQIERARRRDYPEIICLIYACTFSFFAIYTQCFDHVETWHAVGPDLAQRLTLTGIWALCVALPIANYIWVRWVWKIAMWCWYLLKISRFPLQLLATHPDRTGGIGFLSEVQSKFGILLLAYGLGNVAAVTAYKLTIEQSSIHVLSVWAGIVGFVVGAPLLFLIPLFFFTKQLARTKRRAIELFEERAMERAGAFEQKWLKAVQTGELGELSGSDLAGLNNLNNIFDRIQHMRVVPFDLRSIGELFASAMGPMLPLLPYLDVLPEPIIKMIEQTLKLLKGGG